MAYFSPRTAHISIQEPDRARERPVLDLEGIHIGCTAAFSPLVDRTSIEDNREDDRPAVLAAPDVEMPGEFLVVAKRSK